MHNSTFQRILMAMKFSPAWMRSISLGWLLGLAPMHAAESRPWADKDTRLASEYLSLLVEKPEYGQVLELLWNLYEKHQSTSLLLDSIDAQARAQPHQNISLVHAHLLRKSGRRDEAKSLYESILRNHENNPAALRALADLATENSQREAAFGFLKRLAATMTEDDPQRAPLLLEEGRLALETNNPSDAVAAWRRAVELQPDNTILIREIAQLLLGSGFLDEALTLYRKLVKSPDAAKKIDALHELSRIEEQSNHLQEAGAALREGLALLQFREWRYRQFFTRLVKLHERFGQLDALKNELLKSLGDPPQEKVLADLAMFAELTVDTEERIKRLRELVKHFPHLMEYRLQLAGVLIDNEGWQEAGLLLDGQLKNDGSDPAAWVLLRCLVDLRDGDEELAAQRMKKFAAQNTDSETEKQILAFARERSIDEVTEEILRARVRREPDKAEPVMELAAFHRSRQRMKEMQRVLDDYAGSATKDDRIRLNQVAAFLAGGSDQRAAERAALAAVTASHGGREELLRLADVLTQKGPNESALSLLERAWTLDENAEKRMDVDERILALLSGDPTSKPDTSESPDTGFKLPAIFTGDGFGSGAPAPAKRKTTPGSVTRYALLQAGAVQRSWFLVLGSWLMRDWPEFVRQSVESKIFAVSSLLPPPTTERVVRAAWWCYRADQLDLATNLLNRLGPAAPLEAQKLWLDIALLENNTLLAVRQLRLLSQIDAGKRTAYLLRLAEQEIARGDGTSRPGLDEARRILEGLAGDEPQNEAVLSALEQCYMAEGRREDALAVWDKALRGAKGNKVPLLERKARALLAQRKFTEFIATQTRLLEAESDFTRRREKFQRAIGQLLWTGSQQVEFTEEDRKTRLDLAAKEFQVRSRRHPFDGFWHEALAQIYQRQGDAEKAFAEMKQAYYTSPDTPYSLDQLQSSAVRAGDNKSAIYFQKQIAAGATAKEASGEWRELVHLLEQDFQTAEADQVRRRLESRFSQDGDALEELAKYYVDTAQEDDARRVFAQISRARAWDSRNLLRLALAEKNLGEITKAIETLTRLLRDTAATTDTAAKLPVEKLPWPRLQERKSSANAARAPLSAIDDAPGLEAQEREQLRAFFSSSRDHMAEIPDEPGHVRLRAIEELARLGGTSPDASSFSEMERAWWYFYSGTGAEFRALLLRHFPVENQDWQNSVVSKFLFVWLAIRSHGISDVIDWMRPEGLGHEQLRKRKNLLIAVLNVIAECDDFDFTKEDLHKLSRSKLLVSAELIEIARKLEGRSRHDDALILGDAALRQMSQPGEALLYSLSSIAASAGRVDEQRRYLEELWRLPITSTAAKGFSGVAPGGTRHDPEQELLWYYERLGRSIEAAPPQTLDAFYMGLEGLLRLAVTPDERAGILRESWRRLQQLAPSGQKALREVRVLGLAGADDTAEIRLAEYFNGGFVTARSYLEQMIGRLPHGMKAPGPRIDEINHMRGYWDELNDWGATLAQDGHAGMANAADISIAQHHGGAPLGPRTSAEFNSWRVHSLIRRMRAADFPERRRMIREHIHVDDSTDTLIDFGNQLEAQGYSRECIDIYKRLPARAPSNGEYAMSFLRACETSWDVAPALPYLERIFDPATDPVFKPLTINFEELREKHAKLLALLHDETTLRHLAFRDTPQVKTGRIPEQVPYLNEFALLLARKGDRAGALAAWEQISSLRPEDEDATLHRAQILAAQGNRERALDALRKMPATSFWTETAQKSHELRARLVAESGQWEEMRELMNLASTASAPGAVFPRPVHAGLVIALSRVLSQHQRTADALSLLVRGERAVKDDADRFRLRLEQLSLASAESSWDPSREAARIISMLRLESNDGRALLELSAWISREGKTERADAWFALLNHSPPGPNVTLALSALGRAHEASDSHFARERLKTGEAIRIAAETLLNRGQPALALRLVEPVSPLAVKTLGALNDDVGMREIFARIARMSFPGGRESMEYAEAFAAVGRHGLAEELYELALKRLNATAQTHPALVRSYVKFLIAQRRFEEAESVLLRGHQGMTLGLPKILVELYRDWNRLDRLEAELAKFHLPGGVAEEVKFLLAEDSEQQK